MVLKEQYKLYEQFLSGDKRNKIKTLLKRGALIYPEGLPGFNVDSKAKAAGRHPDEKKKFNEELPFFQALKKIYADSDKVERMKTLDSTYKDLLMGQIGSKFVENAKTFNFELTKFINQLTNIKKKASKGDKERRFLMGETKLKGYGEEKKKKSKFLKSTKGAEPKQLEDMRWLLLSDAEKQEMSRRGMNEIGQHSQEPIPQKPIPQKPALLRTASAEIAHKKILTRQRVRGVGGISDTKKSPPAFLHTSSSENPETEARRNKLLKAEADNDILKVKARRNEEPKKGLRTPTWEILRSGKKLGDNFDTPYWKDDPKLSKDFAIDAHISTKKSKKDKAAKIQKILDNWRAGKSTSTAFSNLDNEARLELQRRLDAMISEEPIHLFFGKKDEKQTKKLVDDRTINTGLKKFILIELMLQQLRNQYIDFYVERTPCGGLGEGRESISNRLYDKIMEEKPFANFATVNKECKVIFKQPHQLFESVRGKDGEVEEITIGGNKKTRKKKTHRTKRSNRKTKRKRKHNHKTRR